MEDAVLDEYYQTITNAILLGCDNINEIIAQILFSLAKFNQYKKNGENRAIWRLFRLVQLARNTIEYRRLL